MQCHVTLLLLLTQENLVAPRKVVDHEGSPAIPGHTKAQGQKGSRQGDHGRGRRGHAICEQSPARDQDETVAVAGDGAVVFYLLVCDQVDVH